MQFSDFSLEGLARLEAKLLADVEVVRRMRVLLEEHQAVWARGAPSVGSAVAPVAVEAVAPTVQVRVPVASRPLEELAVECLQALPGATFVVDDLRRALRKRGADPRDASLKTLMNRLIRQGKVVVQETRPGRGGSLYCSTLPKVVAEDSTVSSADSTP
jgi:hypothetical protein